MAKVPATVTTPAATDVLYPRFCISGMVIWAMAAADAGAGPGHGAHARGSKDRGQWPARRAGGPASDGPR